MKKSARALRNERHHKRMSQTSKLSLVSLMDIFTILVFFLIINSSTVEVLKADKSIVLPKSVSKTAAQDNLLLMVSGEELVLQGKRISLINDIINDKSDTIAALSKELQYHLNRRTGGAKALNKEGSITIMGDKGIEYSVLKKILLTCANAGFGDISLAVERTYAESKGEANVKSQ
ncbi:MAG: biopolymer transporter ExbD [Psychrobium sp.]|nr:biopolymer transporter ExbD [Psychrobium sp.]